ncbi:aldehyde dehydrogenase (NADP(+)) [Flavobacteriaceae bacterium XHP0103]|uniref:aldehyde dehydrogenase (NADP(+)) n=1 Tax=Marixanthotalea marina TaxID=2844359 RepID=UPI002989B3F3|nr:aldehyde dehydrogenase (NADP(+)) [Marixanthotalea marina]MBU3821007.1 aldehyde dehydrogenase (NADP(+)) [Marixanthotalea marina]
MELTGKNYIAGNISAKGTATFKGVNPSDATELPTTFYEATPEEVAEAAVKGHEAFAVYRKKSGQEKADFLDAIADEINNLGNVLIERCSAETGLPPARIETERARTTGQLKLFATVLREGSWVDARIDTAIPDRKPMPRSDFRYMQKPLGVVGVFGASNFPLAFSVAGGDTASALASGCPVIVKGHPSHPGTCELVAMAINKAVEKTNMPKGVFSLVQGGSIAVGMALVTHPYVKAIGFTGSTGGGMAIFKAAINERDEPIPVYSEMGSTNPLFILPEALKEKSEEIAKGLTDSVTLGTGQFCTNPGLIFMNNDDNLEEFQKQTAKHFEEVEATAMLNKGIKAAFDRGVAELVNNPDIVKLAAKGKESSEGYKGIAHLFETNAKNFIEKAFLEEENFGPSTLNIVADSREELLASARKMKGHLTATLFATENDLANYTDLIEILEQKVGRLIINEFPTGVEVCHAMVHGGPFPATSNSRSTSVGTAAMLRFTRPVCYQNFPESLLPDELKTNNPLGIMRLFNGEYKR